jgi:hypothetical protein
MTASKASTLILWKIMSRRMPALLTTPSEPAEMIGRRLHDLAGGDRFRHRLEVGDRGAAALLDLLDHFLGGAALEPAPSAATPGSLTTTLAPSAAQQQRDLAADAAAAPVTMMTLSCSDFAIGILLLFASFRGARSGRPGISRFRVRSAAHRPGMTSVLLLVRKNDRADAANMPPTPWQTEIFASLTCAGAMPRICRTLSCSAYMPYMPECM